MKLSLLLTALLFSASALASTASANHGHHGGGNHGAVGAAAGAFGGMSSSSAAAAGQSGQGGRSSSAPVYAEDAYQPFPQADMMQFQKPKFVPYSGE
jgi:hypothetical protein